ncbi:3-deoxy-manno-octulosonate cytidylyltransferase [Porphyridium purpureum]|uniref:3-deoxy-manno-octulosonate cytidylyltransferase n=1 Tax=Porphyridium purpureum TaxID=35688 RepID=A0A5J4Z592_PORPP|nr:3-deoxy-manno-octulosonate cytidylyltransferase [Porphyridium purpureum]|eukprot:POR1325..scf295_1
MALPLRVGCVIPARIGSTRLPRKPLIDLHGEPMIVHVWRRASEALGKENVMVASDDERVLDAIRRVGGLSCMTDERCASGSARVAQVMQDFSEFASRYTLVVNVQGDEPLVDPNNIRQLALMMAGPTRAKFEDGSCVATLATPIRSWAEYEDPNCVKVVRRSDSRALYFSRSPIPWVPGQQRSSDTEHALLANQNVDSGQFLRHVGLYGYSVAFLRNMFQRGSQMFRQTALESCERLEQLHWMERGHEIYVSTVPSASHGVDTADDLLRISAMQLDAHSRCAAAPLRVGHRHA